MKKFSSIFFLIFTLNIAYSFNLNGIFTEKNAIHFSRISNIWNGTEQHPALKEILLNKEEITSLFENQETRHLLLSDLKNILDSLNILIETQQKRTELEDEIIKCILYLLNLEDKRIETPLLCYIATDAEDACMQTPLCCTILNPDFLIIIFNFISDLDPENASGHIATLKSIWTNFYRIFRNIHYER